MLPLTDSCNKKRPPTTLTGIMSAKTHLKTAPLPHSSPSRRTQKKHLRNRSDPKRQQMDFPIHHTHPGFEAHSSTQSQGMHQRLHYIHRQIRSGQQSRSGRHSIQKRSRDFPHMPEAGTPKTPHCVWGRSHCTAVYLGTHILKHAVPLSGSVTFCIDNHATICAANSGVVGPGHYIIEVAVTELGKMKKAHPNLNIALRWSPGHEGIVGNEEADKEADKATTVGSSPASNIPSFLQKTLPKSKAALVQAKTTRLHRKMQEQWEKSLWFNRLHSIFLKAWTKQHIKTLKDYPEERRVYSHN